MTNVENRTFKSIELYDDDILDLMTLNLDKDQRFVLEIGVDHVKTLIKAKKNNQIAKEAPLVVVQGGAGSGKSTVIDVLQ